LSSKTTVKLRSQNGIWSVKMKRSMRLTLELANTTKMEMEKNINNFFFMNFTTIIVKKG
jgi:hypothetical protein